jgi:hypothetical protein
MGQEYPEIVCGLHLAGGTDDGLLWEAKSDGVPTFEYSARVECVELGGEAPQTPASIGKEMCSCRSRPGGNMTVLLEAQGNCIAGMKKFQGAASREETTPWPLERPNQSDFGTAQKCG